ncbi:MAG TPA: hypothetical protein VIV60_11215 [Polyangiaceae bacterium]
MIRPSPFWHFVWAAFLINCASPPRPAILTQVDTVRSEGAVRETGELAPQAIARAEQLRSQAEGAWPKGHTASSEILAERALAAYADARVLAHVVATEQRLATTNADVHQVEAALLKLDSEKKEAAAEAADYDAQLRVTKEAEALADAGPASPEREQARRIAARTALVQARLLCISSKLLNRETAQSTQETESALAEVELVAGKLTASKGTVPLRDAITARSRCQSLLSETRRAAFTTNPTSPAADELFVDLAKSGFAPARDERGVVVTLSKPFAADGLNAQVNSRLDALAAIAKRHNAESLLVVGHSTQGEPKAVDQHRTEAAVAKLRVAGLTRIEGLAAGGQLPIAQNRDLGAASQNERLEVVYVTRQ